MMIYIWHWLVVSAIIPVATFLIISFILLVSAVFQGIRSNRKKK